MIAIIGCGRSGTKYFSELAINMGVDIGHEKMGQHGISSWYLVPETNLRCFGPSFKDIESLKLSFFHQVRNPLLAIASIQTFMDYSWNYIQHFIPVSRFDSLLLKSMKYWYYWNLMARQKSNFTYKIEEIDKWFDRIIETGGIDAKSFNREIYEQTSQKINARSHETIQWEDIEKEDKYLSARILKLAISFGYNY